MRTSFKDIPPVPTATEFVDIVLSRTQRQLPTQIRAGFKISRIRAFYTRKVKFAQETLTERLGDIIEAFPRLNDIHPFHKDLFNTLYDADHFRIALGQLSTAKNLCETISRDYVRLIKYAQSLYQCKQLKRAGLGRMATLTKKLKEPLLYLDQVRQHLGRLPSIDPNTRTLVICGFPNTGKSSFLKSITRADVDVQPYAFTTKSLFVGHFDHQYLRFMAIDTPGILDHPLEEMNTIEMQSITAIAHLRSAILYFMDLSEQCGYPVSAQLALFKSIRPLFANKVVFIAINKCDITKPEDLDPENQAELQGLVTSGDVTEILQMSCNTQEGVQEAKNAACERLMAERVAQKMKAGTSSTGEVGGRLAEVMTRIHVAQPMNGQTRETFIPEAIRLLQKYNKDDPERRMLARDMELNNGGAGVFNVDLKADYLLENDEWKHDKVPEVLDGKNVYDYVDPEIDARLADLEKEEERLEQEGYYDEDEEMTDEEDRKALDEAGTIREQIAMIRNASKMKKRLKNAPIMPRSKTKKNLSEMDEALDVLGVDTSKFLPGLQESLPKRGYANNRGTGPEEARLEAMDLDGPALAKARVRAAGKDRAPKTNRKTDGVETETARSRAERLVKLNQKKMNREARAGEADRHETASIAKHLFSGKRGLGKNQRR